MFSHVMVGSNDIARSKKFTAIEDPPGVRQGAAGELYLAYLRDPDGNKLCALHRMPAG